MAAIDQLYNTLNTRFQAGEKKIVSTDFSGENATAFAHFFGSEALHFTAGSAIGVLTDQKFKVSGKLDLWNLGLLDFGLTIEQGTDIIEFTLTPEQAIANWHFAKSFPDLQNCYLDYLDIESIYLIATTFNHDWNTPTITLNTGLNFYGIAQVSEAIASLHELYPTLGSITLTGIISSTTSPRLVNLKSPLPNPDDNTTDAVLLMAYDSRKSDVENNQGEIKGKTHKGRFVFNQTIDIPLDESPLAKIYHNLQHKLHNDPVLNLRNTDFGGTLAAKFSTVLGLDYLVFSDTKVTLFDDMVEIKGKTTLFGLPKDTIFHFRIINKANSLEMVVYPQAIPLDWKFSASFPQTQDSFFDDLDIQDPLLIASSYSFQYENPAIALVQGINLAFQSSNTRRLVRLQDLGTNYNSINLQGVALPTGSAYNIKLQTVPSQDLVLQLLGLQSITFRSPRFNLQSQIEVDGVISNTAFLSGTCVTSSLTYAATIQVPMDWGPYFQLLPTEPSRGLANIVGVLTLADSQNVGALFPTKFTELDNISVQGPEIYFAPLADKKTLVNTTMRLVDEEGKPRLWQLLDSPRLAVGNLRVGITYGYFGLDASDRDFIFRGSVGGTIVIGTTNAVDISLMVPLSGDWVLSVIGASVPSISDLAAFLQKPPAHLTTQLPDKLYKADQDTTLSEIQIGFDPFTPSLSFVSFGLQQGKSWEILPNFSVENWNVFLQVNVTKNYAVTGHLHGFMKIGSVAQMEVDLPIPPGNQGWTLGLKEGTSIQFPSIGKILELTGGDPSGLPDTFTTFGAFDIVDLAINFSPQPAAINWFRFAMQGREKWVLIAPNKLVINDIVTSVKIAKKAEGGFESLGEIAGTITIFDNPIWVSVKKSAPDQPWKLGAITKQTIHIPGLKDLASWMKKDMASYIPDTFMPFGEGFDLTDFNVLFDLSHNTLQSADFTLINSAKWNAIPGVLGFDDVQVKAKINNFNQENQALSVYLECVLNLGNAAIKFTADRQSAPRRDDPWSFSLSLQQAVTFNELIVKSNLGTDLSLPTIDWLPIFTIHTLEGKMTPADGIYKVSGSATANWQIPLLNIQLPVVGIGGMLDVRQKTGDDANNYKRGIIFGTLDFATVQAKLSLQLGTVGMDTIFTASLTKEQAQNIRPVQFSNQLIAAASDTTSKELKQTVNWDKLAPSDLDQSKIRFGSAYIYFNQTKKQFFLYGEISNFGNAILLAQQATALNPENTAATEQGYLFAFALSEHFTFSKLFSGLTFIDEVLLIRQATLVINSYPVSDAATLKTQLEQITTNPLAPATIRSPLLQSKFSAGEIGKGVHLFAALDLSTPLFSRITALHKDNDAPAVSLYAFFAPGIDSSTTVFSAEFANFTLFDTISFKGASQAVNGIAPKAGPFLQYIPKRGDKDTSSEFTFIGQLGVKAFEKNLAFDSAMVVNQEFAYLTLQPPADNGQSVLPFPDVLTEVINLRNLGLDFTYTFDKTDPKSVPASVEIDLYGSVTILETIDFTGHLHLLGTSGSMPKPVLVEIALTSDLSISRIVNRLVSKAGSTFTWPSNFFDLAFLKEERDAKTQAVVRKSALYYYKASNDSAQKFVTYKEGYNLESTVALTFLEQTLQFNLAVNIVPGAGVKAHLELSNPINLYILQLAGPTQASTAVNGVRLYEHGPTLVLDTTRESAEFGFSTGFNFLQKPFGAATVLFGKDKKNDLKISGTFSPAEEFPPFNLRSARQPIGFSYSKNEGFKVSNWPDFISVFEDVLNIMDQLKTIADTINSADPCAKIANFVSDVMFKTKFGFSNPQFHTENQQLYFVLNGTYTIVLLSDVEVCTVTLPEALRVPIPSDLSLNNLPAKITQALGLAALNFVKALVDNPDALAKFLGIVAAKNASAIGAKLLCQGLIDAAVKAAIDASAAVVLEATTKAGVGAAVVLGGGGAVKIVGEAIKAIVTSNHDQGGQGNSNSNGHAGRGQQIPNPGTPVLKYFAYSDGMLVVNWDGVMFAADYQLWISKPNGSDLFKGNVGYQNSKTLSFNETSIGAYTARLAAIRGNFTSAWSEARILHKLNAPTSLKLELDYVTGKLKASWSQVSEASSYVIQIYRDGQVYQEDLERKTLVYELDPLSLSAGTYHAVLQAKGSSDTIPSEAVTSNALTKRSAPNNITVLLDKANQEISASWTNVLGNNGYRLCLLDSFNQSIKSTTIEVAKDVHNGSIKLGVIPTSATPPFSLQVQTLSADKLDSAPASGLPVIERIVAPKGVSLGVDLNAENINVEWQPVTNAESYVIELVRADNPTVGIVTGTALKNEEAKHFSIDSFVGPAGDYKALVKAIANNATLDSLKAESTNTINRLMEPQIDVPSVEDRGLRGHIRTDLNNVESFEIKLVVDGVPQDNTKLQMWPPAASVHPFFSIVENTPGTEFKVQARSLAPHTIPSQWITGAEGISRLPSPEVKSLTYDESKESFIVTLEALVPGASKYSAQLLIDGVSIITSHELASDLLPTQASLVIPFGQRMPGEKLQVKVRASGGKNFDSPWSLSKMCLIKLETPQFKPLLLRQGMLVVQLIDEVPHAAYYQFRLRINDNYASDVIEINTQPGHPELLEASFPFSLESHQQGMVYYAEVRAFAKGYVPSYHGTSDLLGQLRAPELESFHLDKINKELKVTWSTVIGNNGYRLHMVDSKGNLLPGTQAEVSKDTQSKNLNLAHIPTSAVPPFKLELQALALDKLNSAYTMGLLVLERLAAPQPVTLEVDPGSGDIIVGWQPVEGTLNYLVELTLLYTPYVPLYSDTVSNKVSKKIFALQSFSLSTGNYKAQVTAIAIDSTLDSLKVESAATLQRLTPPKIEASVISPEGMKSIIHTSVSGADKYEIRLLVDGIPQETIIEIIAAHTGPTFPVSFPITDTTPGTEFKVQARSLGLHMIPSLWDSEARGLFRVQAPIIQSIDYEESSGNLIVMLAGKVFRAGAYTIQLIVDGIPVEMYGKPVDGSNKNQPCFALALDAQIRGSKFQVQARAISDKYFPSPWVKSEPLEARSLNIPNEIHITETPVWLLKTCRLPLAIDLDFTCRSMMDSFALCFTDNREVSGNGVMGNNLVWFASPRRSVLTFNSHHVLDDANIKESRPWDMLEVGKQYHLHCVIKETSSTYYINGIEYATAIYKAGFLSAEGYLGFVLYWKSDIIVQNLKIIEG